jgi:hypothetical protein
MNNSYHLTFCGKKFFLIIVFLSVILFTVKSIQAQVPNTLNYQGVITDSGGKPVTDGQYQLTFKLYTVASGGSAIWSETQNSTVTNGIFSVLLGKVTPLANVPFDSPYWLGITVNSGSEMAPRVELSSSAYSLRARSVADSSVTGKGIAVGQVMRKINGITDSLYIAPGNNIAITTTSHQIKISTILSGSSSWTVSGNNISYSAGNVGIGTTTPVANLDVSGLSNVSTPQLWLRDTGTNNFARINFSNASGSNYWAVAGYNNADNTLERLNFYNHATGDLMSISGDGRIGIGTGSSGILGYSQLTTKSHHFYAGYFSSDSSYGRGLYAENLTAGGIGLFANGGINGILAETSGGASGSDGFGFTAAVDGEALATGVGVNYGIYGYASNATTNYGVYADGDMAYTGSLIHASDAKFKENVQTISPVLSKVMELAPRSFTFRKDPAYSSMDFSSGEQFGVIAQEVEKVFPNLVVDAVDPGIDRKNPAATPHPVHYKGVKYLQMIPILLEAIKEQQQEIQQLKSEIEQMKK